eukprot:779588-Rhodomonas_salina.1
MAHVRCAHECSNTLRNQIHNVACVDCGPGTAAIRYQSRARRGHTHVITAWTPEIERANLVPGTVGTCAWVTGSLRLAAPQ